VFGLSCPSRLTSILKGKGAVYSVGKFIDWRNVFINTKCTIKTKMAKSSKALPDRLFKV
jgi:hypothetical protein